MVRIGRGEDWKEDASWEILGGVLVDLGGVLGASWGDRGRCREDLGASWAILSALWRPLGDVSGAPLGISEALEASRRAKMAQDALECILSANLGSTWITVWGARSARASEARGAQACSAKQTEEMR